MDEHEARAFIELELQPDIEPALTEFDIDTLVAMAVTSDADDNEPDDDDWTPTYSIKGCWIAIHQGWSVRESKAIREFSFTTDGQTFTRAQVFDHITHKKREAKKKIQHCVRLFRAGADCC